MVQNVFFSDGLQNYLVFVPTRHIKFLSNRSKTCSWKCIEMSEQSVKNSSRSGNSFAPKLTDNYSIIKKKLIETV